MMRPIAGRLPAFFEGTEWRNAVKWLVYSGIVGVAAGLGAVLFQTLSQQLFDLALGGLAGYVPRSPGGEGVRDIVVAPTRPWLIVALPTLGGLLAGFLVFRFAPEAEGHGTDAAIDAFHRKAGIIPWRVPVVKTVASILTLGSGGSGGREGPIAQIGAGFGSFIARRLKLSVRDRRILVAAGMAGGVGAIFRAPLAGALFASEILYREPEFESEAVIPSAISSIVAFCVYAVFRGWGTLLTTSHFAFESPLELLPYALLALAVSLGAYMFIKVFYGLRDFFRRLQIPNTIKPAVGGFLTGLVGLGLYLLMRDADVLAVLAFGYGTLQGALDGRVAIALLLLVAVGKMLTTGLSIGSGGSGGVFGPSMVIGGSIGGAVGLTLQGLFPDLVQYPGAYVLVGMAGFFAGAANTPVSTIIMVSEMTGNYHLLLPALWVTTICYLLLRRVSLYEKQVRSRVDSPAHRGDFHFDVLEGMKVSDVFDRQQQFLTFARGVPLGTILHRVGGTLQSYFPITDDKGGLYGILSLNDIREYMYDEALWDIAIAEDIATRDVVRLSGSDDLSTAIYRFTQKDVDELPVVAEDDPELVIGLLRRKDVVDAYNRRMWAIRQEAAAG